MNAKQKTTKDNPNKEGNNMSIEKEIFWKPNYLKIAEMILASWQGRVSAVVMKMSEEKDGFEYYKSDDPASTQYVIMKQLVSNPNEIQFFTQELDTDVRHEEGSFMIDTGEVKIIYDYKALKS